MVTGTSLKQNDMTIYRQLDGNRHLATGLKEKVMLLPKPLITV